MNEEGYRFDELPGARKKNGRRNEAEAIAGMPRAEESEIALLASVMMSPVDLMEELRSQATPEHFYLPAHAIVWTALCELYDARKPIDVITLTQQLRAMGELEALGGPGFPTQLATYLPTSINARQYWGTLKDQFTRREIIKVSREMEQRARDNQEGDVKELLDALQGRVVELGQSHDGADALVHIRPEILGAIQEIELAYENRGGVTGLSTGFHDLDRMTSGLQPGYVYVLAARPAMGKTSIGMNIAEHIAIENASAGVGVAIFSIEMTRRQLVKRMVCSRAEINLQRVRDGFLSGERDWAKLNSAAQQLANTQIYIDDSAQLSILDFRARARRAVVKRKAKLLVVDYIQKMKGSSKRARENRQLEIGEIMQGISAVAKELQVPIIVLAQLNRNVEDRKDKLPEMSDLRESGEMEQEAHFVGLLHRPVYYAKSDDKKDELAQKLGISVEDLELRADLIVAKQREGPVGTIHLRFDAQYTRFGNLTAKLWSNNEEERQA